MTKIVCFSDTHGQHNMVKIPECDILIFAGDYSGMSDLYNTMSFAAWMAKQPAKHKILVPGNHDYYVKVADWGDTYVLINNTVTLEGITFLGSPYTPEFNGWNYMMSAKELEALYSKMVNPVDFLITHGPPYKILDKYKNEHIGCVFLKEYVERMKPKYHVFGHNHEQGQYATKDTKFYNISMLNQDYIMSYNLTVLEI